MPPKDEDNPVPNTVWTYVIMLNVKPPRRRQWFEAYLFVKYFYGVCFLCIDLFFSVLICFNYLMIDPIIFFLCVVSVLFFNFMFLYYFMFLLI